MGFKLRNPEWDSVMNAFAYSDYNVLSVGDRVTHIDRLGEYFRVTEKNPDFSRVRPLDQKRKTEVLRTAGLIRVSTRDLPEQLKKEDT